MIEHAGEEHDVGGQKWAGQFRRIDLHDIDSLAETAMREIESRPRCRMRSPDETNCGDDADRAAPLGGKGEIAVPRSDIDETRAFEIEPAEKRLLLDGEM